jgi:hypothetical protein
MLAGVRNQMGARPARLKFLLVKKFTSRNLLVDKFTRRNLLVNKFMRRFLLVKKFMRRILLNVLAWNAH